MSERVFNANPNAGALASKNKERHGVARSIDLRCVHTDVRWLANRTRRTKFLCRTLARRQGRTNQRSKSICFGTETILAKTSETKQK